MRISGPWQGVRTGRGRSAIAGGLLALCLTGCTLATSSSATTSSSAVSASPLVAPVAGATVVVTVPELTAPSVSGQVAPVATGQVSSSTRGSVLAGSTGSSVAAPGEKTATPTSTVTRSTVVPSSSMTAASTTAAPPTTGATLKVSLTNCGGCTVLATHAAVTSTLSAALVATGQSRAALLSLRADGSVAGAANITYGSTFPTPPGGQLACDSGGRCIVIAQQSDGMAIASAYQVSALGAWADVTGQAGITSMTAKAETLAVGGGVGVAVQDQADGSTVWIVYAWTGHGYSVKGCTTAAKPDPNRLTMSACLS